MTPKEKEWAQTIVVQTIEQVVPAVVEALVPTLAERAKDQDEKVKKSLDQTINRSIAKALHANGIGNGYGDQNDFGRDDFGNDGVSIA